MTRAHQTYDDAVRMLDDAATFGIHPSLEGIRALCDALGRPQDGFASVQITGTNGKTSTARITDALLRAEGLSTGLYTSPQLERYPERIELCGRPVADEAFAEAVFAAVDVAERIRPGTQGTPDAFTEFEVLTAAALWLFRERRVDVAVLEVGLGGRWDATSVVSPKVAVITGVGLDHTAILGPTVEAIAAEKAAIIRPGSTAVLAKMEPHVATIFEDAACSAGAPVVVPSFKVTLKPSSPHGETVLDVTTARTTYADLRACAPAYQAGNIATSLAAAEELLGRTLDPRAVAVALSGLSLPGRFELVHRDPAIIVDGSHNPQAAGVLAGAIADAWPARRPAVLLGVLADKDAEGIVRALAPIAGKFAVTRSRSPRALDTATLAGIIEDATGSAPQVFGDVRAALEALVDSARDGLVVTGSLTTAGEARSALRATAP